MAQGNKVKHKGLSATAVEESRRLHGSNVLTPPARDPWWNLFLEKFDDPVIRILMIAAVLAIVIGVIDGGYVEGIGIIVAILLATTLAFINEYKAGKEFDILNKANDDIPVKVIRDGNYCAIPKKDIVVGDVVLVEVGEEVPADGTLLECVSLQISEASLTGESAPVVKHVIGLEKTVAKEESEAYPPNQLLRGTHVTDGHGLIEVSAVGDTTEIGKTARAAAEEDETVTPLNNQLEKLSKWIGVIGFGMAALTFGALTVRGILADELLLSTKQWMFFGILAITGLIGLVRIWLPVIYDAIELTSKTESSRPEWLEAEGITPWLKTLGAAALLLAVGIGAGWGVGYFDHSPANWFPASASHSLLGFFMIAVTIIVVAVPEGLAMSVTLSLAYSMRKMTATNNLVRKMHACETIGAATVICSDKTGTLTKNEMKVSEVRFPVLDDAIGKPLDNGTGIIAGAIAANTTANLSRMDDGSFTVLGNPTEGALLLWLNAQGGDYVLSRDAFTVAYQWTFTTERKYMATLGVPSEGNGRLLHVKGAPEIVLERCSSILLSGGRSEPVALHKDKIEKELKSFQARGMRTLGFACHCSPKNHDGVDITHIAEDMTWLGFVAIEDPIREEVPAAIAQCKTSGIAVKMVTGDNPETAKDIARQAGLWEVGDGDDRHITGSDFGKLSDSRAKVAAMRIKVMSRAHPLDKKRLVELLKAEGQVVAVTGDGVNDGPALNIANVGLAMGKTGTAVAKEASDIILLDDSFKSIVNAVMWGRSLYQNIQRFILFQLTINVAALVIALLGPFIGVALPFTVIQMLWINLIMDTFAALALAAEPPHAEVMNNKPRDPDSFIVTKDMAINIFGVSAVFIVILLAMLIGFVKPSAGTDQYAYRLTVFFSVFVFLQFWNLFNARSHGNHKSAFNGLTQNKGFVVIAVAVFVGQIVMVQFGGEFFRTVPLSVKDWLYIVGGTSIVLWLGEIYRAVKRYGHSS